MCEVEVCAFQYRKLIQLLEEDFNDIALGLQGELLEAYRAILVLEKDALSNALKSIQKTF